MAGHFVEKPAASDQQGMAGRALKQLVAAWRRAARSSAMLRGAAGCDRRRRSREAHTRLANPDYLPNDSSHAALLERQRCRPVVRQKCGMSFRPRRVGTNDRRARRWIETGPGGARRTSRHRCGSYSHTWPPTTQLTARWHEARGRGKYAHARPDGERCVGLRAHAHREPAHPTPRHARAWLDDTAGLSGGPAAEDESGELRS